MPHHWPTAQWTANPICHRNPIYRQSQNRDFWAFPRRIFGWRGAKTAIAIGLIFGTHPAYAQTYEKIPATLDGSPSADSALHAARDELLAIVIRTDRAALNKRVAKSFFWERDHGGMFNRKRSATANLAAATNWKSLRAMLSADVATPRRGGNTDYCLPAGVRPTDEKQFERVAEQLKTDTFFDWGVVISERQPVRAKPDEAAAEVGVLSREVVRVTDWAFETPEGQRRWAQVVTSAGAKGFVDGRRIQTLAEERLCLRKDADGVWRISGYIGSGD